MSAILHSNYSTKLLSITKNLNLVQNLLAIATSFYLQLYCMLLLKMKSLCVCRRGLMMKMMMTTMRTMMMCVYMCTCVCAVFCSDVCIWRPEMVVGYSPLTFSSLSTRQALSLKLELAVLWLGRSSDLSLLSQRWGYQCSMRFFFFFFKCECQ